MYTGHDAKSLMEKQSVENMLISEHRFEKTIRHSAGKDWLKAKGNQRR